MFILPLTTDLRLNKPPYIVYAVMVICVLVYNLELNRQFMYYPDSYNPFTMISATLAHGGFFHILFNLIFFLAFAPALEAIVRSKIKFFLVMLAIAVVTGMTYSITSIIAGDNIPTLGLSGIVMGMIGFSAYVMPRARIRTFFLFVALPKVLSVPAWLLALWFIGWDTYELFSHGGNYGGINIVAHVAGGFSGYFIAFFFFKEQKELARDELEVEIDYMKAKRTPFSSMNSVYKGDTAYVENKLREDEGKKTIGRFMDQLHHMVRCGESSAAINLATENYDSWQHSHEIYLDLFHDVGEWKKGREYLCIGRLVIDLLLTHQNYRLVCDVVTACLDVDDKFVVANPARLPAYIDYLLSVNKEDMAYSLVSTPYDKYDGYEDAYKLVLAEAKLLWLQKDNLSEAKSILKKSMSKESGIKRVELQGLLNTIQESA